MAVILFCVAISTLRYLVRPPPRFYRDCLTAWSIINNKRISSSNQVFDEILWNNQFLRIGNKPLFSKKLFAKGIVTSATFYKKMVNCWRGTTSGEKDLTSMIIC